MVNENELSKQVSELFSDNVFMTKKNETIKEMFLELIEERQKFKQMVKENHNDMDLGKQVRSYFINQGIYNKKV